MAGMLPLTRTVYASPMGLTNVTMLPQEIVDLMMLSAEMDRWNEKLRSWDRARASVEKDINDFYVGVRTLKELFALLAEQPGYGPHDAAATERRAKGKALRDRMNGIADKVVTNCPRLTGAEVVAPDVVREQRNVINALFAIVADEREVHVSGGRRLKSSAILENVHRSAYPNVLKNQYLSTFSEVASVAYERLLKSEHFERMAEDMDFALADNQARKSRSVVEALVRASAASVGALPGPDSAYIAILRLKLVNDIRKSINAPTLRDAAVGALKRGLLKGLRVTDNLTRIKIGKGDGMTIKDHFEIRFAAVEKLRADERRQQTALKRGGGAKNARKLAQAEKDLAEKMKDLREIVYKAAEPRVNSQQTSSVFNWSLSILNVYLLMVSAESVEDWTMPTMASVGLSGVSTAAGVASALSASLAEVESLKRLCAVWEGLSVRVGGALSLFGGALAAIDGVAVFRDGLKQWDGWKLTIGGLEFSSGALLVYGALVLNPALLAAGALLGFVVVGVQLAQAAVEALKDPMRECIFGLIDALARQTIKYNNKTSIFGIIGVFPDLMALRGFFDGSGLGVLTVASMDYRSGTYLDAIYGRLDSIGIGRRDAALLIGSSTIQDYMERKKVNG